MRVAVTLCTTKFNIQKLHVLHTECIYVFVCMSQRTGIIPVHSTDWLL